LFTSHVDLIRKALRCLNEQNSKGPQRGAAAVAQPTVASVVAEFLLARSVSRVFGLLGGHIIPIWDAAVQLEIPLIDAPDERSAAQVRHQQVTLLFQATLIGLPTGIMAALVVCLVLWQAVPAANLIGWALAVTVISVLRIF
jgi:hypothetical protein